MSSAEVRHTSPFCTVVGASFQIGSAKFRCAKSQQRRHVASTLWAPDCGGVFDFEMPLRGFQSFRRSTSQEMVSTVIHANNFTICPELATRTCWFLMSAVVSCSLKHNTLCAVCPRHVDVHDALLPPFVGNKNHSSPPLTVRTVICVGVLCREEIMVSSG